MQSDRHRLETVNRVSIKSAFKFGYTLSMIMAIAIILAVTIIYLVLDRMGVLDSVYPVVNDLFKTQLTFRSILLPLSALALFEVLATTLLTMIGAMLYNFTASIVNGLQFRVQKEAA